VASIPYRIRLLSLVVTRDVARDSALCFERLTNFVLDGLNLTSQRDNSLFLVALPLGFYEKKSQESSIVRHAGSSIPSTVSRKKVWKIMDFVDRGHGFSVIGSEIWDESQPCPYSSLPLYRAEQYRHIPWLLDG
jgi:hypothetical protein